MSSTTDAVPAQSSPGHVTTSEKTPVQSVVPCNFRSAGRLSNDSLRHLHTLHDGFARNTAHALDLVLGSPIGVKMLAVEQVAARDLAAALGGGGYLVPFTLMPVGSRILARFDAALLSPLLDVLLGGTGEALERQRELTDIDEDLIRSVTELLAAQLERTWKSSSVSVQPAPSLKPAQAGQIFAAEERVVMLRFEMTLGSTTGSVGLLLPTAFANALVRSSMPEAARRLSGDAAGTMRLRERAMDCRMTVCAELRPAFLTVGEMLSMQPGTVLNLRTPVQTPVQLRIGNHALFEMTPVRRAGRKTAQLGRSCQPSPEPSTLNV